MKLQWSLESFLELSGFSQNGILLSDNKKLHSENVNHISVRLGFQLLMLADAGWELQVCKQPPWKWSICIRPKTLMPNQFHSFFPISFFFYFYLLFFILYSFFHLVSEWCIYNWIKYSAQIYTFNVCLYSKKNQHTTFCLECICL